MSGSGLGFHVIVTGPPSVSFGLSGPAAIPVALTGAISMLNERVMLLELTWLPPKPPGRPEPCTVTVYLPLYLGFGTQL